jgi:hypothetical protein
MSIITLFYFYVVFIINSYFLYYCCLEIIVFASNLKFDFNIFIFSLLINLSLLVLLFKEFILFHLLKN